MPSFRPPGPALAGRAGLYILLLSFFSFFDTGVLVVPHRAHFSEQNDIYYAFGYEMLNKHPLLLGLHPF